MHLLIKGGFFMPNNKMVLQIRLDESIHAKTKTIAEKELRSLNAQMEYFIMKGVEHYEKEHGYIKPYSDVDDEDLPF